MPNEGGPETGVDGQETTGVRNTTRVPHRSNSSACSPKRTTHPGKAKSEDGRQQREDAAGDDDTGNVMTSALNGEYATPNGDTPVQETEPEERIQLVEQVSSKIPRPARKPVWCTTRHRPDISDTESMRKLGMGKSSISPKGLEGRFKLQMKKYSANRMQYSMLQSKIADNMKCLLTLRDELLRTGKDPGEIPDVGCLSPCSTCPTSSIASSPSVSPRQRTPSQITVVSAGFSSGAESVQRLKSKIETLEEKNADLIEKLTSLTRFYEGQTVYLNKIKEEMPALEDQCNQLSASIQKADTSQDSLEERISALTQDVEMITEASSIAAIIRKKYDRAVAEHEAVKKSHEEKQLIFSQECDRYEDELKQIQEKYENEVSSRRSLEKDLENMTAQIVDLQKKCRLQCEDFERNRRYAEASALNDKEVDKCVINKLNGEIHCLKNELTEKDKLLERLQLKIDHLTEQIMSYELKRTSVENQVSGQMHAQIEKRDVEIRILKGQLTELAQRQLGENLVSGFNIGDMLQEKELPVLKKEILHIHGLYARTAEERDKMNSTMKEMTREIANLKTVNEQQLKAMESQNAFIQALRDNDTTRKTEIQRIIDMMKTEKTLQAPRLQGQLPTQGIETAHDCQLLENVQEYVVSGIQTPVEIDHSVSSVSDNWPATGNESSPPKDYDQMIAQMEEKNWKLAQMERKLNFLEKVHSNCASRRISSQSKIALLEVALADVPGEYMEVEEQLPQTPSTPETKVDLIDSTTEEQKRTAPKKRVKWAADLPTNSKLKKQCDERPTSGGERRAAEDVNQPSADVKGNLSTLLSRYTYQLKRYDQWKEQLEQQQNMFSANWARLLHLRNRIVTLGGDPPQLPQHDGVANHPTSDRLTWSVVSGCEFGGPNRFWLFAIISGGVEVTTQIITAAITAGDDRPRETGDRSVYTLGNGEARKLKTEVDKLLNEKESILKELARYVQQNLELAHKLNFMKELLTNAKVKISADEEFRGNCMDNYISIVDGLLKKKNDLKSMLIVEKDANAKLAMQQQVLFAEIADLKKSEQNEKKLRIELSSKDAQLQELDERLKALTEGELMGDLYSMTNEETEASIRVDKLNSELAAKDAEIENLKMRLKCFQIPVTDSEHDFTEERILDLSGDTEALIKQFLIVEKECRRTARNNRVLEDQLEDAKATVKQLNDKLAEDKKLQTRVIEALEDGNIILNRRLMHLKRKGLLPFEDLESEDKEELRKKVNTKPRPGAEKRSTIEKLEFRKEVIRKRFDWNP